MEGKVVPEHLAPRAILRMCTETNVTTMLSQEAPKDETIDHARIRVEAYRYYRRIAINNSRCNVWMWLYENWTGNDPQAGTPDTLRTRRTRGLQKRPFPNTDE